MFARVELADRVDEAQNARADQIVQVNVGRQALAHLQSHPLDEGKKPDHQLIVVRVAGPGRRPAGSAGTRTVSTAAEPSRPPPEIGLAEA